MKKVYDSYQSPFGVIRILMDDLGVRQVVLTQEHWDRCIREYGDIARDEAFCRCAVKELDEYFAGQRRNFTIPMAIEEGTEFCKKVWLELQRIPYGETRSYADIALAIGSPKAQRAIGQANKRNPLPILIPCHRVIGKNGQMTGYSGKNHIDIKEYLLEIEKTFK